MPSTVRETRDIHADLTPLQKSISDDLLTMAVEYRK